MGFLGVFLGVFFWVGFFCQPCLIILSVWQQVLWRRVAGVRGQVRRVQVPEGGGAGTRRLQFHRRLQQGILIRRGQGQF